MILVGQARNMGLAALHANTDDGNSNSIIGAEGGRRDDHGKPYRRGHHAGTFQERSSRQ